MEPVCWAILATTAGWLWVTKRSYFLNLSQRKNSVAFLLFSSVLAFLPFGFASTDATTFQTGSRHWESALLPPAPRWNESVFQGWCRISPQAQCSPQTSLHLPPRPTPIIILIFLIFRISLSLLQGLDCSWIVIHLEDFFETADIYYFVHLIFWPNCDI